MGGIRALSATLLSGGLMILFLYLGDPFLRMMGVDVRSFAVGGSIVIFLLGLEMVLGHEIFKSDKDIKAVMSLKANFDEMYILLGILINLLGVYLVLISLQWIEKALGKAGMIAVRKFFGVILIAIAVKIFGSNLQAFGK
ncbi:MAG: MarC family protein [Chitinophagaceae bacterium]|nr:MarC family protein [Chitinophagaceae bacterium]